MASVEIDPLLPSVTRPARYTGGEWNAVVKGREGSPVRLALAFPDIYDAGALAPGLLGLYAVLNAIPQVAAERVFAPWADMEEAMRQAGAPLFSLEGRHPLQEFDAIAFTLHQELSYTNILNMLDLAGLPPLAEERGQRHPLVVAWGPGALNPEPLAPFIDAFLLGDPEEAMVEMASLLGDWRVQGGGGRGRHRGLPLLRRLAAIPGFYIPRFYRVAYRPEGGIEAITPLAAGVAPRVSLRTLAQLPPPVTRPVVPFVATAQERATLELGRGCGGGCRRCPGGMAPRPLLVRGVGEAVAAARELLANTGYRELHLLPPCGVEGPYLEEVVGALRRDLPQEVVLSLPPLPVGLLSAPVARALALTMPGRALALELGAGSERLRRLLGLPASDEEVLQAAEVAYHSGFTALRLHCAVGLPSESPEEVRALGLLAGKVRERGRHYHGARARARLSLPPFAPRPHTPFQWARREAPEELAARYAGLRPVCRRAGVETAFGTPWEGGPESTLAAIIARGDRRLGGALHRAWRGGCRLEAWRGRFRWEVWAQALAEEGLSPELYLKERSPQEVLPWSCVDPGVSEASLWEEGLRALQG